jgi:propionyl-CoA carboxylase alpha chain
VINSVLVANRGEIARRISRTCRALGLSTVAVYSDADAAAPHVAEADAAVHLPGDVPADTYLRADLLVDAARRAGADAVHPGYGFLSENAAFARAVQAAGLVWVGPPADAIESMGAKIEAKKVISAAGVRVLDELDPAAIDEWALPVLVKASAGGGGRGMRVVGSLAELAGQLEGARSEAASAFGDPTVFCERYLPNGRHIEVQIMADRHGAVWAVGERECSIQRRHQKVVEEAPSPLVERTPGMRARLFDAATAAARAISYEGTGTVEFLVDPADLSFYFLEMNTRLQVEHSVTECTTGLDLVRLQLQIADGARLPAQLPQRTGHAIEVRLYAEDPAQDWQPQTGTVRRLEIPGIAVEFAVPATYGLRLDSGVVDGSRITTFYDPMLAKVIAWAATRDEAARVLGSALARARIHGVRTNRDLLVRVLRHEAFLAGDTDTAFLGEHDLTAALAGDDATSLSALAAALADSAARRSAAPVLGTLPPGWRNVASQPQRKSYEGYDVEYRLTRDGLVAPAHPGVGLVSAGSSQVVLDVGGVRRAFDVAAYDGLVCVDSALGPVSLTPIERFPDPSAQVAPGSLLAPMPGNVVRIAVAAGEAVSQGQPLLWLEAMKMEHLVRAPADGFVTDLPVAPGQQVDVGTVLAIVQPSASL